MSHNVSIQGTSGKTNYYLSFGYNEKQGQMKIHPDELKKYNASVNVTTNVYDWLQVGARINYSRKNYKRRTHGPTPTNICGVGVLISFLRAQSTAMTHASWPCRSKLPIVK